MTAEYIKLYPENPEERKIKKITDTVRKGGLIIFPTDTVYSIGCDLMNPRAVDKVRRIRDLGRNADLSFICSDLSQLSQYANVVTPIFKLMKRVLPGPYTFILKSSSQVPKILKARKMTVGIRVPDNLIPREIVKELGNPIMSASIKDEDEVIGFTTDPEEIYEKYKNEVDIVIDGGYGGNVASTIIDCTMDEPEIVRVGKGDISML